MKVCRIRSKKTGKFWEHKGRSVWHTKGSAKTAYTNVWSRKSPHISHKFNEQDEYEIIEYVLVEKEEYKKVKEYLDKNVFERLGFNVY